MLFGFVTFRISSRELRECRRRCMQVAMVFSIAAVARAQSGTQQVEYTYEAQANCNTVESPDCGLMQASDGNFYGTAVNGGADQYGAIFRLTSSGTYTVIYSFTNGMDGSFPESDLVEAADGNLYGTAGGGGANKSGVVFRIGFSGTLTTIYSFCSLTDCADGGYPDGGLTIGSDGNFYGMANQANYKVPCDIPLSYGCGTIYKLTPQGQFTLLHSFDGDDGGIPHSGLVQGSDGDFYGVAPVGGILDNCGEDTGCGTVFKITADGNFTLIHAFADDGDSASPTARMVEAKDGNLYGTALGDSQYGGIFGVSTSGNFSTVHLFSYGKGGALPYGGLVSGSDGNLYGTTITGGTVYNCDGLCGTAYQLDAEGKVTILYDFCSKDDCTDGHGAGVTLVQGNDGSFYGTTIAGGDDSSCNGIGCGTIYQLTVSPALVGPVQLAFSPTKVSAGSQATLAWQVSNAFSTTMQQCFAFIQGTPSGAGTWSGKQSGTYNSSTKLYTGSSVITPTTKGTYTYALTCGGKESGFATLNVTSSKPASTTALSATPNPATVGEQVSLGASVSGSSGIPSGSITLTVGSYVLGGSNLNSSGVASFSATTNGILPGTYSVVANYSGNSTYMPSSSQPVIVTLDKAPTMTTLSASPATVTPPSDVELSATVVRSSGTGMPTGTITFTADGHVLGVSKLNSSGVASVSVSSSGINSGEYPLIAKYNGDASDQSSVSSAVEVTVK